MTYWRMQLHPAMRSKAVQHTIESLAAGYLGLDFIRDVGDLTRTSKEKLPENQRNYWAFAHEMQVGDIVLVATHNYPFAVATVSGEYNYIREIAPEIKVWFRHFRRVENVHYFADTYTNASQWPRLVVKETILPLRNKNTQTYDLIEDWLARIDEGR